MTTTTSRVPSGTTSGASPWRRAAAVVLLVVLALGGGVLIGRATVDRPAPPSDLATPTVRAMIRDQIAAANSGDARRLERFYAPNATMTDIGNKYGTRIRGGPEIARVMAANIQVLGPFLRPPQTLVQRETFVAYAGSWGDVAGGVVVYELTKDGKILNQWAIHPAQ